MSDQTNLEGKETTACGFDSGFISGEVMLIEDNIQQCQHIQTESHSVEEAVTDPTMNYNLNTKLINRVPSLSTNNDPSFYCNLEKVVDRCFSQDEDGDTLLHIYVCHENVDMSLKIVRMTPHPLYLDIQNDDGHTALHLAAASKQSRLLRWLIVAGANPRLRSKFGNSALHIASKSGDLECCRAITVPVTVQERASLKLLADRKQPSTNRLGLDKYEWLVSQLKSVDLEQWNSNGQTCLLTAAEFGHVDVVRHLVQAGADVNARDGLSGYSALHYAIMKQHEKLLPYLVNECPTTNLKILSYGQKSVLQFGYSVPAAIEVILKSKGVPYDLNGYDSSDESELDEDEDSEDEQLALETATRLNSGSRENDLQSTFKNHCCITTTS